MENQENFSAFDNSTQTPPENNMALAIVGTIVGLCAPCCLLGLIPGIIAIVYSSQVNSKFNAGDYPGAMSASKNARTLSYVAIGLGILGIIINIVWYLANKDSYMMMLEEYKRQLGQ